MRDIEFSNYLSILALGVAAAAVKQTDEFLHNLSFVIIAFFLAREGLIMFVAWRIYKRKRDEQ